MARGEDPDPLLAAVERRRGWPTRATQALQVAAQDRIIGRLLVRSEPLKRPPWPLRLLDRSRLLRRIPARLVGLGLRREHVRSPKNDV